MSVLHTDRCGFESHRDYLDSKEWYIMENEIKVAKPRKKRTKPKKFAGIKNRYFLNSDPAYHAMMAYTVSGEASKTWISVEGDVTISDCNRKITIDLYISESFNENDEDAHQKELKEFEKNFKKRMGKLNRMIDGLIKVRNTYEDIYNRVIEAHDMRWNTD